jgi:protease PrsW
MQLLALAIGPGLILLHLSYVVDRHREPVWNVVRYVIAGAVAVFLASWLETSLGVAAWLTRADEAPVGFMVVMVLGVGAVEEGFKLLVLGRRSRHDHALDEPFDWVVYAVAVALGFATLENVLYVAQGGMPVAVARAFTAVPMHALCGTMMGWRLARAAIDPATATRERLLAFVEPTLWHGIYDALAGFTHVGHGWAPVTLLVFVAWQWRLGFGRVRGLRQAGVGLAGVPPILLPGALLEERTSPRADSAPRG